MIRIQQFALSFLCFFIPYFSYSQCSPAPPLFMQNPSFEGPRQAHQTPGPWQTCQVGQTPDTQPGNWGVTLAPSNGTSYLGLVAQYANSNPNSGQLIWQEGASQALSGPLSAGTEYSFTVDLSNTNATGGGIQPGCAEVQIWGGFNRCDKGQLLWSSGNLTNYDQWLTFNVNFIPNQNFTWFSFIINPLGCSALPYVLIDNITPIQPKTVKATLNLLQGVLCNGGNTGSLKTTVKGDYPPFTYNWSAPIGNRLNDSVYQNLSSGWNYVTVTDNRGCTSKDSIFIPQPGPFALDKKIVIDANCFGNGGSAMLQYKGATPKSIFPYYTYNWTNGSTKSGTQTPLSQGWYYLTVTDSNNCIIRDSVQINIGAGFTVDTLIRRNSCLTPSNNIDIVLTPIGGTAPFSYLWNTVPVQNTSTASNLNTGSYSVTITDNLGCKDTLLFNVNSPPKGVFINYTKTDVKCSGQNTGSITLNVTNLNPIASYTWSPNVSSNSTATNLNAGTYRVTVTDNTGCFDTATIVIAGKPPITDSTYVYNIRCFGESAGYIDVKIQGGTKPYSYQWNTIPVQTDSIAKNLVAGNYSLTVTDSNNCVYTISKSITQPSQPLQATFDSSTLKCKGDTTAFLQINLSGGTPTYFYEWSTDTSFVGNTPQVSSLGAGVYYVKGQDANGCAVFDTFTIKQPADYVHPNFSAINVCRNQAVEFVNTSDTSTKVGTLNWQWNFGDGGRDSSFNVSHLYSIADTFKVKLIANTNGCLDSFTKTVRTFYVPIANFSIADICQKDSATIINSSSIGGGSMNYNWDFGNGNSGTQSASNFKLKYAAPGFYTVRHTLTSDSSCTDTMSRVIHVKKSYVANFTASTVCENDSTLFVNTTDTTGNVAIVWNWNYGDNTSSTNFQQNKLYATGGNYIVQLNLLSAEGCSDSITKNIRLNYRPTASFSIADICQKDSATIINSSSIGGGSMNYNWDFGDGNSGTQSASNFKLKYVAPGIYTVRLTLTSDSACTDTMSRVIHVKKSYVANFNASTVCESDSTLFVNTTDTTGNVAIAWNWNYGDNTSSTNYQQNKLYATGGNYFVQLNLLSAEGCSDSITKNIRVNYRPTASFSIADICQKDSATIINSSSIGGGSMNYNWDFGNGNSGTQSASNFKLKYVAPGIYTVRLTLTSDSACTDTMSRVIHVKKSYVANFNASTVCESDSTLFVNTTDTTGNVAIAWNWNYGDNTSSTNFQQNKLYATGGNYIVKLNLLSAEGCSDSITKNIRVNYRPMASFSTNNGCLGLKTVFTNSSTIGNGTTSYSWNYGDGSSGIINEHTYNSVNQFTVVLTATSDSNCIDTAIRQVTIFEVPIADFRADSVCLGEPMSFVNNTNSGTFIIQTWNWDFGDNGLSAVKNPLHTYPNANVFNVSLIATTTNNCADTVIRQVRVNQLPTISSSIQDISCFGKTDGSINVTPGLGQLPFNYNWQPPSNVKDQLNIGAGTYTLLYVDAFGCKGRDTFLLQDRNEIFVDLLKQDVVCFGESNGSIIMFANGGESPLSYLWSNGSTSSEISNLSQGVYQVTITDSKGCTKDTSLLVDQPNQLIVNIAPVDTIALGESVELIANTQTNGGVIQYAWTPATGLSCVDCNDPTASPYKKTTYTLLITDSTGCKASGTVTVFVEGTHLIYTPNAFTPNGDNLNDKYNAFTRGYKNFSLRIFNRWGEKVYETNIAGDPKDENEYGWDGYYRGELQPPGVYVFEVQVEYLDQYILRRKGSVTLIR